MTALITWHGVLPHLAGTGGPLPAWGPHPSQDPGRPLLLSGNTALVSHLLQGDFPESTDRQPTCLRALTATRLSLHLIHL